jgi:hypothetical protein
MLAIIGTYRGFTLARRLLESLDRQACGITEICVVNDAASDEHDASFAAIADRVINTRGAGYNLAMREVCRIGAEHDSAVWLEEDFTLTAPVDFDELAFDLDRHPSWAQIVLQRQPWFPNERRAGSMIAAVKRRGHEFHTVDGYLVHDAFFSGNPSIWRRNVFATGWPAGAWSEDQKRDQLLALGYEFAITPEILCHHEGVRSGHGY